MLSQFQSIVVYHIKISTGSWVGTGKVGLAFWKKNCKYGLGKRPEIGSDMQNKNFKNKPTAEEKP